jgi:RimJ/RimL family protein N-acetyltransferase
LRHDLHLDGYAFRLRPVEASDAAFIVELRARAGEFLNRGAATVEQQLAWLARYFARDGDYYFVIESIARAQPEGLVGIYDVAPLGRDAEWGRWVLAPGSNGAVESSLLVYRCAFERLGLSRLHCRTLAQHAHAIAFHDSCGLARTPGEVIIEHNGERRPAVEHTLTRADAGPVMARLERLAARFATAARANPSASGA